MDLLIIDFRWFVKWISSPSGSPALQKVVNRNQKWGKYFVLKNNSKFQSDSDGSEFDFDNAIEEKPMEAMDIEEVESDGDDDEREVRITFLKSIFKKKNWLQLQAAFAAGLLKDGLNIQVAKKRPIINKSAEMKEKLAEITKDLPWVETLEVVTPHSEMDKKVENDDFQRELNL